MLIPDSDVRPGTTVRVKQTTIRRGKPIEAEVVGVVEACDDRSTGSWYAGGKCGKLWLKRIQLRKADGEVALLVVDDGTEITGVETPPPDADG